MEDFAWDVRRNLFTNVLLRVTMLNVDDGDYAKAKTKIRKAANGESKDEPE